MKRKKTKESILCEMIVFGPFISLFFMYVSFLVYYFLAFVIDDVYAFYSGIAFFTLCYFLEFWWYWIRLKRLPSASIGV